MNFNARIRKIVIAEKQQSRIQSHWLCAKIFATEAQRTQREKLKRIQFSVFSASLWQTLFSGFSWLTPESFFVHLSHLKLREFRNY
ncbi:MAG: hypothetical protein ACR2H1_03015, partial [Limisphaerales bacterium]